MTRTHETVVTEQYGSQAMAYVESTVHAQGNDLDALERIVRGLKPEKALDLGSGGGHVAYVLARHAGTVVASDLSAEMLAAVAATACAKGLGNVETAQAAAEHLPFADAAFDFLACRYSAHHWADIDAGLRQARRVLKKGAPAIFIDACSPGRPLMDTHLQAVELLRDTSHGRNYSAAEWMTKLSGSNFAVTAVGVWQLRMDFPIWIARMRTPEVNWQAIRALQTAASADVRDHFAIEPDGSFMLDIMMAETVAA